VEPPLQFKVLGPLEVLDEGGAPVAVPGRLGRALLSFLLLHRGRLVTGDTLAEAMWGDEQPADPLGAVQTQMSRLRQRLPAGLIATRTPGYLLETSGHLVDAEAFEQAYARAAVVRVSDPDAAVGLLDQALGWWRGPAYDDLADAGAAHAEATRLAERRWSAQEDRLELLGLVGRAAEACAGLEALVEEQPLRERAQALLMVARYRAGRQADALRGFEAYRRLLADELGLDPSPALRQLEADILHHRLDQGGSADARPRPSSSVATPDGARRAADAAGGTVLPRPPAMVGRSDLLAPLLDVLAEDSAVVTLTGPGGVGKTTVALHVAEQARERFPGGVWFCPLADAPDSASVGPLIATAIGVTSTGAAPDHGVVDALAGRSVLLVLDNCEHVLDGAAELVERLAAAARGVRVLATSRERLAVTGERVWPVAPLPAQGGDGLAGPAAELFVARATAVDPGFVADDLTAGTIVAICQQLDGLPLAIELAAARVSALSVEEIAAGLGDRFRLLTAGRRTAAARHQSLTAAVTWSHELLTAAERHVFDQLAVFSGGFRLAAAEAVVDSPEPVGDVVFRLVDKSLVVARRHAGGTRYALLETLRAFGAAQLAAAGTLDATRQRHAVHQLAFAEAADRGVRGPDEASTARALDEEIANLRAAHAWLVESGQTDQAFALHRSLQWYAWTHLQAEVLAWAERCVAAGSDPAADRPGSAGALGSAGFGAWQRGDLAAARRYAERALAAAGGHDPTTASFALQVLGDSELASGVLADAARHYQRGLDLAVGVGDEIGAGLQAGNLALVEGYQGNVAAGVGWAMRASEHAERTGCPSLLSFARYTHGEVLLQVDPAGARALLTEALDLARSVDARFLVGVAAVSAASVEARHGDPLVAAVLYRDLLDHWRRAGNWTQQWTMLRSVVSLLTDLGQTEAAARLLGALLAAPTSPPAYGHDAAALAGARHELDDRLGADQAGALVAEGADRTDVEAVALAAAALDAAVAAPSPPPGGAAPNNSGVLTSDLA
jgi:predicted ATPase/DNA-binding SARP family transcriptional activator